MRRVPSSDASGPGARLAGSELCKESSRSDSAVKLLYDYGADLKNTMATRDGGLGVLHVAAELRDSVGIITFCLDKVPDLDINAVTSRSETAELNRSPQCAHLKCIVPSKLSKVKSRC